MDSPRIMRNTWRHATPRAICNTKRPLMGLLIGAAFAAVLVTTPTAVQAQDAVAPVQTQPSCPDAIIIAARGTLELPGRYGWAGITNSEFLRLVEELSPDSLANVEIYALEPQVYPAIQTTIQAQTDGIARTFELASSMPLSEFAAYQQSGYVNAIAPVAATIEEKLGECDSRIVLLGYSQGAMILRGVESKVAEHLAGAMYFGNPVVMASDPAYRGNSSRSGGSLSAYPPPGVQTDMPRFEYCRAGDVVCDAQGELGIAHLAYAHVFRTDPAAHELAREFTTWLG